LAFDVSIRSGLFCLLGDVRSGVAFSRGYPSRDVAGSDNPRDPSERLDTRVPAALVDLFLGADNPPRDHACCRFHFRGHPFSSSGGSFVCDRHCMRCPFAYFQNMITFQAEYGFDEKEDRDDRP
jgi:hypothetical protein